MTANAVTGSRSRLRLVDHSETYGRHVLRDWSRDWAVSTCIDIGCGDGDDLGVIRGQYPAARLVGVDCRPQHVAHLNAQGIDAVAIDVERDPLPLADGAADLVIANQVLEHTKEIYWILHETFRVLRPGGRLYLGVPNHLSLHNRLLGLAGVHPTTCKLISAHVRPFSKPDTLHFFRTTAATFAAVRRVGAAQFYPFPRVLARPLARLLPTLALSIFFDIEKTGQYKRQFLDWPAHADLETHFFTGVPPSREHSPT